MKTGIWLTTANVAMVEIASILGFDMAVFDLEHGIMDPTALEALVGLSTARGVAPYLKVAAPEPRFIMEGLDRGAAAVIVPQIQDLAHAERVTAYAKYPPMGKRGGSGGRVASYARSEASFYTTTNTKVKCIAMIETYGALRDIDAIAALGTVDGLFVGPTDLALSCGRGSYTQSDADFDDITRVANAAKNAGKSFLWPAWSEREQAKAVELGAETIILSDEIGALKSGMEDRLSAAQPFLEKARQ